jgi:acetyl esterase/lipase
MRFAKFVVALVVSIILISIQPTSAGPLRHLRESESSAIESIGSGKVTLPVGTTVLRDQAYGADSRQTIDVYVPSHASNAPVLFMVHGGAWKFGDKAAAGVVENKAARWLPKGFVFVSINYPMLPRQDALGQVDDVARALAFAQAHARSWGGDPTKFIVMGHSAGAHLVALLTAAPERAYRLGAKPWLGTVTLDSAALDVVQVMERGHLPFYDQAFGRDQARWRMASPIDALSSAARPILAVCSQRRLDHPCTSAADFVAKATALGIRSRVSAQDLSHEQINRELGLPSAYTDEVEAFMGSLDASVAAALATRP